jgi:regulator of protease activity HflC (stomatin/prohibitin superfamily)
MADIYGIGFFRHLRADATSHVLHYRNAKLVRSGRGAAFWFSPFAASLAEVPVDDRELTLALHGRSGDFQDVVVQGVLTYRIVDPERTAGRIDFTIDPRRGTWLRQPLEKLALVLSQLAQQHALACLQSAPLRELVTQGPERVRLEVEQALVPSSMVAQMGVEVVSVRISAVKPTPEVERALEAPMREHIAQEADEATFRRRALAVEKERAIAENELQNQIELARREEQLIEQQGLNEKRQAVDHAESARIAAEAGAGRVRIEGMAEAERITAVEGARGELERKRLGAYRSMPPAVLAALAAQEFATKIECIEHLNITPDLLGPLLSNLLEAGTKRLNNHEPVR